MTSRCFRSSRFAVLGLLGLVALATACGDDDTAADAASVTTEPVEATTSPPAATSATSPPTMPDSVPVEH